MKTVKNILQLVALFLLAMAGMVLVLVEERDLNVWAFMWHVLVDKVLGVACIGAGAILAVYWVETNPLLRRFFLFLKVTDQPY